MAQSAIELVRDWKHQRFMQIRRLSENGSSREELVKRFGKQAVSDALDKTKRYY